MQLPADQAIARFRENEERVDVFVNNYGLYTTNTTPPQQVETLPSLMQRLQQRYVLAVSKGAWSTGQSYLINDIVTQGGLVYLCTQAHTSGTFATDLTGGKWVLYQALDSALHTFTRAEVGAQQRKVRDVLRADFAVCPFAFMTEAQIAAVLDYTSTEDLTTAVATAVATGRQVYLPAGKWKFNLVINNKTIIFGDGATATRVYPYDNTKAAMLYTLTAQTQPLYGFWDYHSEIHGVGFFSNSTRVGVGFSFGKTNPTDYTTNDEYANNVKFFGCYFEGLDKGVQFPFGNIGSEFYSCGFASNYYGVYSLSNKFGNTMHAGNKHFYGGEMHGNECAVYVHNTADGFGDFAFTDVIFEGNNLCVYLYNNSNIPIGPMRFLGCWNEANGSNNGYSTAVVDNWTGSTKTTQTLSSSQPYQIFDRTVIFDGGFVGGVNMGRENSMCIIRNARTEANAGVGGQPFATAAGSLIIFEGNHNQSSLGTDNNPQLVRGRNQRCTSLSSTDTYNVGARSFFLPKTYNKVTSPAHGGASDTFTTAKTFSGSTSGTGTVVADGIKYANCNEFTYTFGSSAAYIYPWTYSVPQAGYYVFMADLKVTSGSGPLKAQFSNLSTHQSGSFNIPADGKWYTIGGIVYMTAAAAQQLWFGGATGTWTWRASAVMFRRFDSEQEALAFLDSGVYLEG